MGDRQARVRNQIVEKVEFLGRKVNGVAILAHQAPGRMNFNLADFDHFLGGNGRCFGSADGGADARGELSDVKGFGDVIVRTRFERFDLAFLIVVDAEHEDRHARYQTAHLAARLDAALARHVDIQQHTVIADNPAQRYGFVAGTGFADVETQRKERAVKRAPDGSLIVNN